jgi:hypothetical protein
MSPGTFRTFFRKVYTKDEKILTFLHLFDTRKMFEMVTCWWRYEFVRSNQAFSAAIKIPEK